MSIAEAGCQADSDKQPLSDFRNNIYITWNDLSSNCTPPGCSGYTSSCNNDIFIGIGVPNERQQRQPIARQRVVARRYRLVQRQVVRGDAKLLEPVF